MARWSFRTVVGVAFGAALLAGCTTHTEPGQAPPGVADVADAAAPSPSEGGIRINTDGAPSTDLGADCDPSRSVQSGGAALIERDPAALAGFSLKRVLTQLFSSAGGSLNPEEQLRRMFDTLNTSEGAVFGDAVHCDDPANAAFQNAPAIHCPRAEGALAQSTSLLTPDTSDFFAPVALVNRFDLAPQNFPTCGEFRIVFAKQSGRTDPQNRVLLIAEAVLRNPTHSLKGCRPIAEFWASLELVESAEARGALLERFFFDGLPGFDPVISTKHFAINRNDCQYGLCGRLRLGLGMQLPWDFRQFELLQNPDAGSFRLAPVPLDNMPVPALFDDSTNPDGQYARSALARWSREVARAEDVGGMRLQIEAFLSAGESGVSGATRPNLLERVRDSVGGSELLAEIDSVLAGLELGCPEGDPMTHESALARVTALTCAGCHAPLDLVSPTGGVGCGIVWPNSLGPAHIDESGNLSPALGEVFLPRRADVMSTYLKACDLDAITAQFPPPVMPACFVAGTPITMADGSLRPIEAVRTGDRVLSFDLTRSELVPGLVTRTFVHPGTAELVVVNETLVTTANHPFYSGGAWSRADSLEPGSALLALGDADPSTSVRLEARSDSVRQLATRAGTATTYNFEVTVHHNYFAGSILVHNKPPPL